MVGRSLGRKIFRRKSVSSLDYDPYDKEACGRRANGLLDEMQNESGTGAVERCRQILAIIESSYPTKRLAAAYFSNLELHLRNMPRLEKPGQLVIGLGPGRCGSTSLTAMLGAVANSCCTHETPPLIFWKPQSEQVDFHLKRFRLLTRYYSLVADVSHWWLNSIEQVLHQFPNAKVIGLIRDEDDCAMSFMRIQGFGEGSSNPWVACGSYWRSGHWDPTYPTYDLPRYADRSPDFAKLELIKRYVHEYNAQIERMSNNSPDRVRLVRTEELSRAAVRQEIFQFANTFGPTLPFKLNVKRTTDGKKIQIKL